VQKMYRGWLHRVIGAAICCRGCRKRSSGGLEDSRGSKGGRKKTKEEDSGPKCFTMRVEN
jgi:hypothetical protein